MLLVNYIQNNFNVVQLNKIIFKSQLLWNKPYMTPFGGNQRYIKKQEVA